MNQYNQFNKFQQDFYTNISAFDKYTHFEIKQNAFMLLNNLIKGNPDLATTFINLYSPEVKCIQSPAIIKALQRKFINGFSKPKVPQFIYYKSAPTKKSTEKSNKSSSKKEIKFDDLLKNEIEYIQSNLLIDYKTIKYLIDNKSEKIINIIKLLRQ